MEDVRETKRGAAKCQRVKEFSLSPSFPPSLMHKHEGLTRNIHREYHLPEMDKTIRVHVCMHRGI